MDCHLFIAEQKGVASQSAWTGLWSPPTTRWYSHQAASHTTSPRSSPTIIAAARTTEQQNNRTTEQQNNTLFDNNRMTELQNYNRTTIRHKRGRGAREKDTNDGRSSYNPLTTANMQFRPYNSLCEAITNTNNTCT